MWAMTVEEVITESLDNDNLALQSMSSSRYVQVRQFVTCMLSDTSASLQLRIAFVFLVALGGADSTAN